MAGIRTCIRIWRRRARRHHEHGGCVLVGEPYSGPRAEREGDGRGDVSASGGHSRRQPVESARHGGGTSQAAGAVVRGGAGAVCGVGAADAGGNTGRDVVLTKRRAPPEQPLIEIAEGSEADDRAALFAAWKRLNDNPARRRVTNLHVRELLLYVFVTNTHGRGTKLTYEEIAVKFECTKSTARSVVDRASNEFGLLAVMEDRYVNGGQTANRYSINWPMVRSVNMGFRTRPERGGSVDDRVSSHDSPLSSHDSPLSSHDSPLSSHDTPYKETPVLSPVLNQYSPPPPAAEKTASEPPEVGDEPKTWEVVVSALVGFGMRATAKAVDAAKSRSLTAEDAWELVERWERLRARQPDDVDIRWLFRWLTGQSLPPPEPWESTHGIDPTAPPRRRVKASDSTCVEMIRSRVVTAGRKAKATEEQMSAALRRKLQEAGYPPDAVGIDGSANVFTGGRSVFSASTA